MIAAPWHAAGRRRHRDERDRDGAEIVFVAGIQQEGKANQPRARVAWTPRVTGSCSASLTCCPYPSLIPDPCPNRAGIGTKCPNPFSDPRDFQGLARGKTRSLSKIWEDSDTGGKSVNTSRPGAAGKTRHQPTLNSYTLLRPGDQPG